VAARQSCDQSNSQNLIAPGGLSMTRSYDRAEIQSMIAPGGPSIARRSNDQPDLQDISTLCGQSANAPVGRPSFVARRNVNGSAPAFVTRPVRVRNKRLALTATPSSDYSTA
jgi:hypothetical protein